MPMMKICICDDDLNQCENNYAFDCIFLDIQMKELNGIDCARKIREIDSKVILVFLSAIKDYVFEGYEVNAMRYLLKPLQENKCHELLDMIQNSIEKESAYVLINKTKINCDDITYIESYGHYCGIHTAETIESKISISDLLKELPDTFIQTHRSYIVNLEHVESILKDKCVLDTQELIPISRNSVKKVNESFMEFIKGGIY